MIEHGLIDQWLHDRKSADWEKRSKNAMVSHGLLTFQCPNPGETLVWQKIILLNILVE